MSRHEAEALAALVTATLAGPSPHHAPALLAAALADLSIPTTAGGTR